MKTKQKNLLLVVLCAFFALFLGFGIVVKNAFAETNATLDSVTLTMQEGASVRVNEPTGLRFRSLMSASDYNALMLNVGEDKEYSSVSFGMLIAPQDYIDTHGELTADNVFGENAKYSFGEEGSEKPEIINVYADSMQDCGDNRAFVGIVTNIKPTNYNRDFVGVGYIKTTAQNGAISYKFATANDNARSVISVAQKVIDAGETDENGVLTGFTKYASLGGIVSSVENGDKTPQNAVNFKTGEISVTATADNLYINLDRNVIAKNGAGYDYVRLYLKSKTENGVGFMLLPHANGAGDVTWTYKQATLDPTGFTVDIPLNDTSVHDFSAYDLRLYARSARGNITIEKIEYISLAKDLLKADSWYSDKSLADGGRVEANDSISVRGWDFGISSEYIQKAIEAGYTHLRFDYQLENSGYIFMKNENFWQAYYKQYAASVQTARFDLSSFKIAEENGYSYAKISMQGQDLNGTDYVAKTEATLTVTNPTLFKSTETASWNKDGRNSIYCAEEENGFIVLDTVSAGNDAHVLSTTEWWEKYANNGPTYTDGDNQRTVILSGKYLYAGDNTRGAVWGNAGEPASVVGGTANAEIVTEYMNNLTYTEGNTFYYGLDKEGVYALKVNEFVSNRNSSGGFAYTYVDGNTFTVTLPINASRIVNVNTQDYILQGYTKVVITVSEYTGGQIWVGNGKFGDGGYMHGLDSGASKELDLTQFTSDNPYLHIYCANAKTTVTVTYNFF